MNRPPMVSLAAFAAVLFIGIGWRENLRLNLSGSMPTGLWRIERDGRTPQRGDIVSVCLPADVAKLALERGYIGGGECALNSEPLIKPIVAVAGDEVTVSSLAIEVNGRVIENTAQRDADTGGRPLTRMSAGIYAVPPGSVWLASGHDPRSFDSRYFGAVPVVNVRGIAAPVFVIP